MEVQGTNFRAIPEVSTVNDLPEGVFQLVTLLKDLQKEYIESEKKELSANFADRYQQVLNESRLSGDDQSPFRLAAWKLFLDNEGAYQFLQFLCEQWFSLQNTGLLRDIEALWTADCHEEDANFSLHDQKSIVRRILRVSLKEGTYFDCIPLNIMGSIYRQILSGAIEQAVYEEMLEPDNIERLVDFVAIISSKEKEENQYFQDGISRSFLKDFYVRSNKNEIFNLLSQQITDFDRNAEKSVRYKQLRYVHHLTCLLYFYRDLCVKESYGGHAICINNFFAHLGVELINPLRELVESLCHDYEPFHTINSIVIGQSACIEKRGFALLSIFFKLGMRAKGGASDFVSGLLGALKKLGRNTETIDVSWWQFLDYCCNKGYRRIALYSSLEKIFDIKDHELLQQDLDPKEVKILWDIYKTRHQIRVGDNYSFSSFEGLLREGKEEHPLWQCLLNELQGLIQAQKSDERAACRDLRDAEKCNFEELLFCEDIPPQTVRSFIIQKILTYIHESEDKQNTLNRVLTDCIKNNYFSFNKLFSELLIQLDDELFNSFIRQCLIKGSEFQESFCSSLEYELWISKELNAKIELSATSYREKYPQQYASFLKALQIVEAHKQKMFAQIIKLSKKLQENPELLDSSSSSDESDEYTSDREDGNQQDTLT